MATIWYNSSYVFLENSSKITGQKNMTGEGESYLDQAKSSVYVILPVYVIVLAACLIGNILVCVTVMKSKEMRRKKWYYFLVNLAIADMGFALITPMYLLQSAGVNMGDAGCKIAFQLLNITLFATTLTLAYISVHRYVNICHPTSTIMTRIRPSLVIVCLWVSAGTLSSPMSFFCRRGDVAGRSCDCVHSYPSRSHQRIYHFSIAIMGFYIPFLTMLFCYTMITVRLVGKRGDRIGIENDQSGKKKRSIKMMVLATSFFFIALFPYSVLVLLKQMEVGDPKIVGTTLQILELMAFSNSASNPYIYCLFSKEFRNGFKNILCRRTNIILMKIRQPRAKEEHARAK